HAERFAAADAVERLFLLDEPRRCRGGAEIELWFEADHLLWARRLAKSALYASIFHKAQRRTFRIVAQRARRAGGDAREAERAALDVDLDAAEGRPDGKRNHIDGRGCNPMQLTQGEAQHVALGADRREARWLPRGLVRRACL